MGAGEASRGTVHAVAYDGAQEHRIASAPVGGDAWAVASIKLPVGAGPVPLVQLVLSGDGGWVLENDRTVVAGARLVNGTGTPGSRRARTWSARPFRAVERDRPGRRLRCRSLASAQGDDLLRLARRRDSFIEIGKRNPTIDSASGLATPNRATIVIGGTVAAGSELFTSSDGGQTWSGVLPPAAATFADLGFTTPTQGIVIQTEQGGTSRMLMSHDAGKTWTPIAF